MSSAMKSLPSSPPAGPEDPATAPKFAKFTVTDLPYKRVNGTPILASVLVPKDIKPGKHPLTVRWHGGFLVTGHRLYADWYVPCRLSPAEDDP